MLILLVLAQIQGVEGLGLVAGPNTIDDCVAILVTALVGAMVIALILGVPGGLVLLGKWLLSPISRTEPRTCEAGVQANLGMTKKEQLFTEEYINRSTGQRAVIHEQAPQIAGLEAALREARRSQRSTSVQETVPAQIAVSTNCGEKFHRPGCGNLHTSAETYTPCGHCVPNRDL